MINKFSYIIFQKEAVDFEVDTLPILKNMTKISQASWQSARVVFLIFVQNKFYKEVWWSGPPGPGPLHIVVTGLRGGRSLCNTV